MKILIALIAIATINVKTVLCQCMCLFTYDKNYETVTFYNQSSISHPHYFWNFGDGTSSFLQSPTHRYPETGNYLVTLFAKDTINNCSSYYETWLNVTKYSTDTCQTDITDSIFLYDNNWYLKIIDNSTNCNMYNCNGDVGPALNFPPYNWIYLGDEWHHARFISRVQYYTYDTTNWSYEVIREAYKTSPFFYSSDKNYGDCSANFEFSVISQDTVGQKILFRAMNNTATDYEWTYGLTSPMGSNSDTTSYYYHYNSNDFFIIGLKTIGSTGCKDTLYQQILVRDSILTFANIDSHYDLFSYQLIPNPIIDQAIFHFSPVKQKTYLTIYNTTGQFIKTLNPIKDGQILISRRGLSNGLYFFKLWTNNGVITTGKFLVE